MSDDLEARLKSHARSFDSLLSLIPAKLYYGEDNSDQWKRKKQTPEQKRAAKKAKLDPDNWKSAKDVADEREATARKRKRDESDDSSDDEIVEAKTPQVEESTDHPKTKKRKTTDIAEEIPEEKRQRKQEEKAAKKERKRERKEKARLKLEKWQARKKAEKDKQKEEKKQSRQSKPDSRPTPHQGDDEDDSNSQDEDDEDADSAVAEAIDLDLPSAFTTNNHIDDDASSVESSDDEQIEVFSPNLESSTSSISSIQTPLIEITSQSKSLGKPLSEPEIHSSTPQPATESHAGVTLSDTDAKARLQAALSAFKSARAPTNPTKSQPKSRAELLAQRRAQEDHRKAEKKAQKAREKEEAVRKQEQEIAARFSPGGSGSLLGSPRSPIIHSPSAEPNNFSFGRIAFEDGTALNADGESSHYKKKGPQDPRTALAAAQQKQARISGLDAEKRENIESKNMWSNARKRASGEKVKDDTSLLKKALKRHDSHKKKSEKEWDERQDGINRSMEMRQKKRNDNLAKRRDEKGGQKGKKPGKVKRPGFEGSFKGRTGGGKKKT